MENKLNKLTIPVCKTVLDCEEDCLVSGDFMLPEYCPDIAVVLKCLLSPRVQSRQWSGERLLVDGMTEIRVLYLDEERTCVRSAEFSQPFSCSLPAKELADGAMARLHFLPKYVNCRAVSPRRLEVRGALSLCARAEVAGTMEVAVPPEDSGLFTRTVTVPISAPATMAERIMAVSETFDFPADLPPAELMLGGDCWAIVRECKLLTGKAIVKGQVFFHQMYTDDAVNGGVYCLDFDLPFSQILDMEGATDGQAYSAHVTLLSDTERCVDGPEGGVHALEVAVKLLVQVQLYENQTLPLVLDAYHSACPVRLETGEVSAVARLGCQREETTLSMSIDLPAQPLDELVDVWVQPLTVNAVCADGKATMAGRMLLSMVVRDTDGMLSYYERPEDYRLEYPCPGNSVQAQVAVTGLRYRAVDGKLELHISLQLTMEHSRLVSERAVMEAVLDEERCFPPERATVKLYYADAGESLWDIGRSCHTSPEVIAQENNLHTDLLERPMVLTVPLC